jgi:hypothetical protein
VPLDSLGRNVYLDGYHGGRWQRMMGVLTHRPTGFFSLWIRSVLAGKPVPRHDYRPELGLDARA